MTDKEKERLVNASRAMLRIAQNKKLMDENTARAHIKLAAHDPEMIYGEICKNVVTKLGLKRLWREHGDIMQELSLNNPAMCRVAKLAATPLNDEERWNRTPPFQVLPDPYDFDKDGVRATIGLIYDANRSRVLPQDRSRNDLSKAHVQGGVDSGNLVSLIDAMMYLDLIKWDPEDARFVERDILGKVVNWTYEQLKENAPLVLVYLEKHYQEWYESVLAPYRAEVRRDLEKRD